jgi:hypothetical protein
LFKGILPPPMYQIMEKEFEDWLEQLRFHGVDGRFIAEKLRECFEEAVRDANRPKKILRRIQA